MSKGPPPSRNTKDAQAQAEANPANAGEYRGLRRSIMSSRSWDNPSVALAQRWLEANPEAPSALRRLVLEAQDHGRRSIVAQKFNASLQG